MKPLCISVLLASLLVVPGISRGQDAAAPSSTSPSTQPAGVDARLERKIQALGLMWADVESKAIGSEERKTFLEEFMVKSVLVRELPEAGGASSGLWMLRGIAALELNRRREAWEAGQELSKRGLETSADVTIQKLFAGLERQSLITPSDEELADFKNPEAAAKREQAKAAEARRLQILENLPADQRKLLGTWKLESFRWDNSLVKQDAVHSEGKLRFHSEDGRSCFATGKFSLTYASASTVSTHSFEESLVGPSQDGTQELMVMVTWPDGRMDQNKIRWIDGKLVLRAQSNVAVLVRE